MPPEQVKAWLADRQGVIVGVDLAQRFDWKVGDRVPIQGTIWQPKEGQVWEFNIVGHLRRRGRASTRRSSSSATTTSTRTARAGDGLVGWYIVKIADPAQAQEMSAKFDEMFANSSAETKTTTEKGFVEGFAKQIGDIGAIMVAILVGRAVHDAAGRRQHHGAVGARAHQRSGRAEDARLLERLDPGAGARRVGVHLRCSAAALGLGLAWLIVQQGDPTGGMLPIFILPPRDVAVGAGLIVLLGLVAGALPAVTAMHLKITDALRRELRTRP